MTNYVTPYKEDSAGKKQQVITMFNNIAGTYDFFNHFLSLGIDVVWRKKAINYLKSIQPKLILDVATGTGDFAFESLRNLKPDRIIGVDISQGMLDVAQKKIDKRKLNDKFKVQLGDSESLDFENQSFDAVTVAFGVRNFENLQNGLNDVYRVLKPGGKAVVLEFSNPKKFPVKQFYDFYFHIVIPLFGKLFSKDKRAYSYLPESVAQFVEGEKFVALLENSGFKNVLVKSQTFGICSIYIADK